MKSLAKPPALVKQVMNSFCVLLGAKQEWAEAQKLMANSKSFLNLLINFDKDNCPLAAAKKSRKVLGDVTVEHAKKVSLASSGLTEWIIALTNYVFEKNGHEHIEEVKEEQKEEARPTSSAKAKKSSPGKKGKKKISSPSKEQYSHEEAIREDSTTPLPREEIPQPVNGVSNDAHHEHRKSAQMYVD